jgi:hypothetical protein
MLIYAKIINKHGGCIIESVSLSFASKELTVKELKATIYG